jgi:Phosphotransferase enzyme family
MTVSSCSSAAGDASGIRTHEFQDALALLASAHDPIPELLEQFCSQRAASQQDRRWKRIFGRFDPDKQPYCAMVYAAGGDAVLTLLVVELYSERPEGVGESYFHDAVSWAHIATIESDVKLSTLPQLISGVGDVDVVRYRPRMRCTLRVRDHGSGQVRYAKVFPDHTGEEIHRSGVALWQAAERGELGFRVARPAHWDAATRTVWQGCVPGAPVVGALAGESGADMAWRLGHACASLPQSTVRPCLEFSAAHQLEATARNVHALTRYLPGAGKVLETFLSDLTKAHQQYATHAPRPIHGAPHAHQWLADGQELGLVDFDRFCLGDPELDVATFIAEMDFERSTRVPVAQLNQAFIEGYESGGVVLCQPVLQAYRAHKRLAKALRSARAIRPDGTQRALQHLARASEALRGDTASLML